MYPLEGEPFKLFESSDSLSELGSSFSLYFVLLNCILFYMSVVFFVACLACLIGNIHAGNSYEWNDKSDLTYLSLGNYGNPTIVPNWQGILHMITVVIVIVICPFLYRRLRSKAIELDLMNITPSDFTVWVKGLPPKYTHDELEEYLVKTTKTPIQIISIVSTYDIGEFVKNSTDLLEWEKKLDQLTQYKEKYNQEMPKDKGICCKKEHYDDAICFEMIHKLKKEQKALSKSLSDKLTPVAFVTVQAQVQARKMSKEWDISRLWRFLRLFKSKKSLNLFKGKQITVGIAPDPSDVYWENLSVDSLTKLYRRVITFIVAVISIFITFISLYYINNYQKSESQVNGVANPTRARLISTFSSLLVVFINILLTKLMKTYTEKEMHHTWSTFNLSLANKLVMGMFLNSTIIPLVVNYDYTTMWFTTGGLANNIFWIEVANAVVNPILYIIYPQYQLKRLLRWIAIKRGLEKISQGKANELFTGPEVELSAVYANLIISCLLSIFYAPLVPIGLLVTACGIILGSFAFKYILINVHCRPIKQGDSLGIEISRWLRRIPTIYASGVIIFYYNFCPDIQGALIALIILVVLYNWSYLEFYCDSRFKDSALDVLENMEKDNDKDNDYNEQYPEFYTVIIK